VSKKARPKKFWSTYSLPAFALPGFSLRNIGLFTIFACKKFSFMLKKLYPELGETGQYVIFDWEKSRIRNYGLWVIKVEIESLSNSPPPAVVYNSVTAPYPATLQGHNILVQVNQSQSSQLRVAIKTIF
jgi:hypothetical protein